MENYAGKPQTNVKNGREALRVERSTSQTPEERAYLTILLKYDSVGKSVVNSVYRVSTPGRRVYVGTNAL